MSVETVNIIDNLDRLLARRCTAYTAIKRDYKATMTTLIGANFQ